MRRNDLTLALMILGLAGCQLPAEDLGGQEVGQTQQASVGGGPAIGQSHYEAVAAITILLPLEDGEDPEVAIRMKKRYRTGVLIEERTVMTLAGCLSRNYEAEIDEDLADYNFLDPDSVKVQFGASASAGTEFYLDASFDGGPTSEQGLTMHRYFDPDLRGRNDIALLRLSASPGITPVPVHAEALGQDLVGMPLELVGYGKNDGAGQPLDEFTARNVVSAEISQITDFKVEAGTTDKTTCYADQGGPGFLDFGSGAEVVSVSAIHDPNECVAGTDRPRVDIHAADFIEPFLRFASGGCDGGACDDCDYNGVCKEDCPTRDWDCELGVFTGGACNQDGDCEEAGHCVPAGDDPSFTYCSKPCDPDADNPCPSEMACEAGECIYAGISPGSQGAVCTSPADCRSNFCENGFCAFECDPADAEACDTENGFFCLPDIEQGGTNVCRTDERSGGGGFCHITAAGTAGTGARNGFLAVFGLLFLVALGRRRYF